MSFKRQLAYLKEARRLSKLRKIRDKDGIFIEDISILLKKDKSIKSL